MPQSSYRRPPGFEGTQTDPEESYRAGFQHGTRVLLRYLESTNSPDMARLQAWIDGELTRWRHDTKADPIPPAP